MYYNRSDGSFGSLGGTPSGQRLSVVRRMAFPVRPNSPVPLKAIQQILDRRLRRVVAVKQLLRAPSLTISPLLSKAASLRGFSSLDEAHHALGSAADVANEFLELSASDASQIGTAMLLARGGEIASSLGLPTSFDDLVESSRTQLALFDNLSSVPGGDMAQGLVQTLFGQQVSDSFLGQGESIQTLLGISQDVRNKFGSAWSDISQVVGDLSGIMDGGVRSAMEELTSLMPSGASEWLNERTVESVVGIARTWSSEVDYSRPGSIMSGVGGTIALAGAACPPPANAIVAAVGGVVSLVGFLVNLLMGNPPPDPDTSPCSYLSMPDADAWAVLRLYLFATGEVGGDVSMTEMTRGTRARGWGAQFDPYTGEVLVQKPGSGCYRRILDVFDRKVLLDAYEAGEFNEWLLGTRTIKGADPINVTGSDWLSIRSDQPYALRRALYCSLDSSKDTIQRGYLSTVCSTARRFRVYAKELGVDVNSRRDHGPRAIGWAGKMDQPATGPFWIQYRSAMLASAFLGGTTPYGRYDSGTICTGVGGKIDQENPSKITYPFAASVGYTVTERASQTPLYQTVLDDGRPRIVLTAPRRRSGEEIGRYTVAADQPAQLGTLLDMGRAILTSDTQRASWNVPAPSPVAGEIAGAHIGASALRSVVRSMPLLVMQSGLFQAKSETMSSGSKAALWLGGLALAGGGGYLLYRKLGRRSR